MTLEISNLHASVEGKQILKGLNLQLGSGEIHALMGPNGSGKSTLANVLLGHPKYTVDGGEIMLDGENVLDRPVYPWDLIGSIYELSGIDPQGTLPHPQGLTVRVTPSEADGLPTGGRLTEIM